MDDPDNTVSPGIRTRIAEAGKLYRASHVYTMAVTTNVYIEFWDAAASASSLRPSNRVFERAGGVIDHQRSPRRYGVRQRHPVFPATNKAQHFDDVTIVQLD